MNDSFLLNEGLKITNKMLEILEMALLEIIKKDDPKHGELTIAKALLGQQEDMSIMIFDTLGGTDVENNIQMHNLDAMRKRMMDQENGVGQVCYMVTQLEDGRTGIIFRAQDNDRVNLLARDLKGVGKVQGIDMGEFDIADYHKKHEKNKDQER